MYSDLHRSGHHLDKALRHWDCWGVLSRSSTWWSSVPSRAGYSVILGDYYISCPPSKAAHCGSSCVHMACPELRVPCSSISDITIKKQTICTRTKWLCYINRWLNAGPLPGTLNLLSSVWSFFHLVQYFLCLFLSVQRSLDQSFGWKGHVGALFLAFIEGLARPRVN